jgi:hypothetical protein
MPAPRTHFKTILELVLWNGLQSCRRITPDVINVIKMPSFQYFLYLWEHGGCSSTVICLPARNSLTVSFLIQSPTFSRWHTETHWDNNRRHSERDCHRSTTTTQLWNADMPTLSNYTQVSVHCCHGKHTVASSRTLLSDLVYYYYPPIYSYIFLVIFLVFLSRSCVHFPKVGADHIEKNVSL